MADKMIRRVVTQAVTVVRDGRRVTPEMHKSFDFTKEEIEYLDRISPAASRKAVDESPTTEELEAPEGGETGTSETSPKKESKPTATKAPRRGKKAEKPAQTEEPEEGSEEEEDDDI